MKYLVGVREVIEYMVAIEAKDPDEARELVEAGEGDTLDDQRTQIEVLDRDTWSVYKDC